MTREEGSAPHGGAAVGVRVVGCGHPDAGDDCVGLEVAERLRGRVPPGVEVRTDASGGRDAVDWCRGAKTLIIIDAARATGSFPVGAYRRIDYGRHPEAVEPVPAEGTHSFGVAAGLRLAEALGALPRQVWVYAIAAGCFDPGSDLSPPVAEAVGKVAADILETIERAGGGHGAESS